MVAAVWDDGMSRKKEPPKPGLDITIDGRWVGRLPFPVLDNNDELIDPPQEVLIEAVLDGSRGLHGGWRTWYVIEPIVVGVKE